MRSHNFKYILFVVTCIASIQFSCSEKQPDKEPNKLRIVFKHQVGGQNLKTNELIYRNAAGNPYEISEVMYFISDLVLYHSDGSIVKPDGWTDIHYVDSRIPSTMEWFCGNDFPTGYYNGISFTFGIKSERNKSFMFVNPPEVNMAWPEVLGGGYHYLMMNGFWKDTLDERLPFNFHLGIGQIYENNSGQIADITEFIDNSFTVEPDGEIFYVAEDGTTTINLIMDINSWFETPIIYDHNRFGGAIMQNQEAMHIGCMNGRDAFYVTN